MRIDVRDILKLSGLSKTVEIKIQASESGVSETEDGYKFNDPIYIVVELSNIKGMIRAKGSLKTEYDAYCARCLKPLRVTVDKTFDEEYVQFGSLGEVRAEDAEVYEYSDKEIDLSLAIRDAILLELPIRHLCGDGCMSLCPKCGKNLNDGPCGCAEQAGDARFWVLQTLLTGGEDESNEKHTGI